MGRSIYSGKVSNRSRGQTAIFQVESREKSAFLRYSAGMTQELDEKDLQILDLLQSDARQSAETIAQIVNLSASAVQRRIARLRDDGANVQICWQISSVGYNGNRQYNKHGT
jgi:predicted HTH transcriptional regulator